MAVEYDELRIRVWKIGTQRYFILANGPEIAGAVITLEKPAEFYLDEFNNLLKEEFGRVPFSGDIRQRLQNLGMELFGLFFPEPIDNCLRNSFRFARANNRGLRLRFDLDTELMDIPLEVLHVPDENDPLGFLVFNSGFHIEDEH